MLFQRRVAFALPGVSVWTRLAGVRGLLYLTPIHRCVFLARGFGLFHWWVLQHVMAGGRGWDHVIRRGALWFDAQVEGGVWRRGRRRALRRVRAASSWCHPVDSGRSTCNKSFMNLFDRLCLILSCMVKKASPRAHHGLVGILVRQRLPGVHRIALKAYSVTRVAVL